MLSSKTLPSVRREQILSWIETHQFARVTELSTVFDISEVTVRSDLDHLEQRGQVRRVHGGAVLHDRPSRVERSFEEQSQASVEEKKAIGTEAAGLVAPGDTVIIDVGTTCAAVAEAIVARTDLHGVTVVTNGLNIARIFEPAMPRFSVVVTGGTVRPLQHSLVDPFGGPVLERLHADLMFLGCNGVHAVHGVTNINLPEAEMKRRMMGASRKTVTVADGSKIGQLSTAWVCDLDEIDLLITTNLAADDQIESLEVEGLDILQVEGLDPTDQTTTTETDEKGKDNG